MADWEVIGEVSSKKPPPAVKVKPRNRLATAEKLQNDGDEKKKPIMPSPQARQKGKEMVSINIMSMKLLSLYRRQMET